MSDQKTDEVFVVKPTILSQKGLNYINAAGACCDLCGNALEIGQLYACMYTNDGVNKGGNPWVCHQCLDLSRKERLTIWNLLHDSKYVRTLVRNEVLDALRKK